MKVKKPTKKQIERASEIAEMKISKMKKLKGVKIPQIQDAKGD